jgi:hypothetical protein
MDIFLEGLNILFSTFCVCADGFQSLSKAFHYPIQLLTSHLFLWNHLQILKMPTETLLRIPFSLIGRCSLVQTSHWLQGKCARINLPQSASGMILQKHRRLLLSIYFQCQNRRFRVLKLVTGRVFKITKKIQRSKTKLWVWFFLSTTRQKSKNYQRMYIKYLFIIISLKKC